MHAVLGSGECVGELSLIDGGSSAALVDADGALRQAKTDGCGRVKMAAERG